MGTSGVLVAGVRFLVVVGIVPPLLLVSGCLGGSDSRENEAASISPLDTVRSQDGNGMVPTGTYKVVWPKELGLSDALPYRFQVGIDAAGAQAIFVSGPCEDFAVLSESAESLQASDESDVCPEGADGAADRRMRQALERVSDLQQSDDDEIVLRGEAGAVLFRLARLSESSDVSE